MEHKGYNLEGYEKLARINEEFCLDAGKTRWQLESFTFSNRCPYKGKRYDIFPHGIMRTIECEKPGVYMFFIDIDGKSFTPEVLEAGKKMFVALTDMSGHEPVMKSSGKNGIHLYYKMKFPDNWTREHIFYTMKNIAFTAYNRSGIREQGFLIGLLKKENLPEECPGFIDTRVYRRDGMIRGFCIHPESGKFSIPIGLEDTYEDVIRNMETLEHVHEVSFQEIHFNLRAVLDLYSEQSVFTEKNLVPLADIGEIDTFQTSFKGDRIFSALPPRLKAICRMKDDVAHDLKWPLVAHLHYYFLMNPTEIETWIWKNVKWTDLKDKEETMKHIVYTCDWVERHKYKYDYIGIDIGKEPIKREFYDDQEE